MIVLCECYKWFVIGLVFITLLLIIFIYNFNSNKDEITLERILTAKVIIFGGPRRKFTASEVIYELSLST